MAARAALGGATRDVGEAQHGVRLRAHVDAVAAARTISAALANRRARQQQRQRRRQAAGAAGGRAAAADVRARVWRPDRSHQRR